ncbi:hypothetical protein DUI87_10553 [Hirundo rustica rustica]|uniref:Centromere protein W n=1 Tax=Hirundo rustica rustica TaxID=333673 RepID=A0A3M0KIX8_HIRRU|nr:hypothetical protein DUI87_10553 [Hirundo rustica rustica]
MDDYGGAEIHLEPLEEATLEQVHLSFLLFLHRLAEEARTNAFANKSKIIKPEHTISAAKVILKKSRG